MVALKPGVGGTITGATAERALFQVLQWWQIQEQNDAINPLDQEFFSGTKNTDTNIFEGKWKLPVSFTNAGLLSAGSLYQGLSFSVGTEGDIAATTAEEYTLKLMLWIINKQKDTANSNPEKIINVTGSVNLNEGVIEGEFKLPFLPTLLPSGGTQDLAREYLL